MGSTTFRGLGVCTDGRHSPAPTPPQPPQRVEAEKLLKALAQDVQVTGWHPWKVGGSSEGTGRGVRMGSGCEGRDAVRRGRLPAQTPGMLLDREGTWTCGPPGKPFWVIKSIHATGLSFPGRAEGCRDCSGTERQCLWVV